MNLFSLIEENNRVSNLNPCLFLISMTEASVVGWRTSYKTTNPRNIEYYEYSSMFIRHVLHKMNCNKYIQNLLFSGGFFFSSVSSSGLQWDRYDIISIMHKIGKLKYCYYDILYRYILHFDPNRDKFIDQFLKKKNIPLRLIGAIYLEIRYPSLPWDNTSKNAFRKLLEIENKHLKRKIVKFIKFTHNYLKKAGK
jgi:hypothetical protein